MIQSMQQMVAFILVDLVINSQKHVLLEHMHNSGIMYCNTKSHNYKAEMK